MTNDRKNGTQTRNVERAREASGMQASLATDDRPESVTHSRPANWAWALSVSAYDWMDSHYFTPDLSGAPG
jgi:hypothetical protein